VAIGADLTFSNTGVLTSGFAHTPGSSQIVVANSGTYFVQFNVSTITVAQVALVRNGVVMPEAIFQLRSGNQTILGQAMLELLPGDVLSLRNTGTAVVTLQTINSGTQIPANASLTIEMLPPVVGP
jgi:hypothetical protein